MRTSSFDLPPSTTLGAVPIEVRPLYDLDHDAGGVGGAVLNRLGRDLRALRQVVNSGEPGVTPTPRRAAYSLKEWSMLLAAATAAERPHLVRACAEGRITVKRD